MKRIQVMSDLHLEQDPDFQLHAFAPYLALCGDIGSPCTQVYVDFLLKAATLFEKVFIIAGNHEHYGSNVQETLKAIDAVCLEAPDVLIHLNKQEYDVGNYRILGATLWSSLGEEEDAREIAFFVSDFRLIRGMDTWTYERRHAEDVYWLQEAIYRCVQDGRTAIVLTHHAPTFKNTSHVRHAGSTLSNAFATNLEYLMGAHVPLWCCGHTHHCCDQIINGTRVLSNQRGYPGESTAFDPNLVVDV